MNAALRLANEGVTEFGQAHLYRHPSTEEKIAKVFPGQLYGTAEPIQIVTLLGSCVSACVRDPVTGFGGMNHFMLPAGRASGFDPRGDHRYGQVAMDTLLHYLEQCGAERERMEVKLFGGGNMQDQGIGDGVGERNIAFAEGYCQAEGLHVLATDLGLQCPRKVVYNPVTGIARVKRVAPMYRELTTKHGTLDA